MNDELRRTGRTTRMVEEAIKLARCGHAVCILVHEGSYARLLRQKVDDLASRLYPGIAHGIKVEAFDFHWENNFDWNILRQPSAHPNSRFLLDHALVEKKIEQLQAGVRWRAEMIGKLYPKTV